MIALDDEGEAMIEDVVAEIRQRAGDVCAVPSIGPMQPDVFRVRREEETT
jgi:hypothetical protein